MRQRFERWIGWGLALVAGLLVLNLMVAVVTNSQLRSATTSLQQRLQVIATVGDLRGLLSEMESFQRGYLITGDARFLETYRNSVDLVIVRMKELETSCRDHPRHALTLAQFREGANSRIEALDNTIARHRREGIEAARRQVLAEEGAKEAASTRALLDRIHSDEQQEMERHTRRNEALFAVAMAAEIATGLFGLILVGAFVWSLLRALFASRKLAAELREQRERWRVTLMSIGDGVIITDAEGRVDFLNTAAESMLGIHAGASLGQDLRDVFSIVDRNDGQEVEVAILRRLRVVSFVKLGESMELRDRSGRRLAIEGEVSPVRAEAGQLLGAIVVFRDVSVRERSRRELLHAREYAETIVDTLREAVVVLTSEGVIRTANRAFFEMFATETNEIAGKQIHDVDGWKSEDVRGVVAELFASEPSTERNVEIRLAKGMGPGRQFLANARHFRLSNETDGLVLIVVEDITERRRAEEEVLRLLIREKERSERLRMLADASLTVHTANSFSSVRDVVLSEARRLLPPGTVSLVPVEQRPVARPGCLVAPLIGRDGEPREFLVAETGNGSKFSEDDAAVLEQLAFIGAVALQNALFYDELRQRDRHKDEFLALLAHELRNPLAPIRGALEIMRRSRDDDTLVEQQRQLIERQIRQMARLIDDLLDLSRVSRGQIELRRAPVDLREAVDAAIDIARPVIDARKHHLVIHQGNEPLPLVADLTRLAQVFANLLNNAAKYSGPGSNIILCTRRVGETAEISVRDFGDGIPDDMLGRVFEMFTRLPTHGPATEGLGVGLSLARSLVRLHGGSIEVHSDGVGEGSEFIVRLPLAIPPAHPSRIENSTGMKEASAPASSRRILVVDDNVDAAQTTATMIRLFGHEVRAVHDGAEALPFIEQFDPDVVLLDIGLPGMSGYDVARALRSTPNGRRLTLIALTGWGQAEDRRRSRDAGFDHHLVKPVEPDELERLLRCPESIHQENKQHPSHR